MCCGMDPGADNSVKSLERPGCEKDWDEFVDAFGQAMLQWAGEAGLPDAEAALFVGKLLRWVVGEFHRVADVPELRFRAWLKYCVHSAWCQMIEKEVGEAESKSSGIVRLLLSVASHDDLLRRLDAECIFHRRRMVLAYVRRLVDPDDWEAFYRVILEQQPVGEVAVAMQSRELAVRAAIHRVNQRLNQELQKCDDRF